MKPRNFVVTILFLGSILMGKYHALYAQNKSDATTDSAFVNWARVHAVKVDNNDLHAIDGIIGNARVVALGEPAHGFHQALAFRNGMFRYLVEKLGFTTISLEANFAKCRIVSDFIDGGPGNVEQVAKALTIGNPTIDDIELIRWMREYNQQSAHKSKIKLRGMDMEMLGVPGDTTPSHPAIDETLAYLNQVDHNTAEHFSKILAPFLNRLSVANYTKLSKEEHDKLSEILDAQIVSLERKRSQYIAASTKYAYEWAYENAVVARQTDRVVRLIPPEVPGKISPDAWRTSSARDSSMAKNVLWMVDQGEKVFVYAHSAHVKNAPTTGGVWDAFNQPPNSEGQYLRAALGSKLLIFGMSFIQPFDIKQPSSIDAALAKTGKSNFLLDLRTVDTGTETAKWLETPRPMQMNIATYMNLPIGTAFDAIVYLDNASPTFRIQK